MFTDSELYVNRDVHAQSHDIEMPWPQNRTMGEQTFAENLKRLRKAADLTQDQLADAAGVSKSYISGFERGERESPSSRVLAGLAKALNCEPAELYQGEHLDAQDEILSDIIEATKLLTPERQRLALKLLKGMADDAA
jgi:transcriptional regulator with XRE-family HTH domain